MSRHFQKQPVMVVQEASTLISSYDYEFEGIDNVSKRGGIPKNNQRKKSQNNSENTVGTRNYRSTGNSSNANHGVGHINSNSAISKVFKMVNVPKRYI